MARDPRGRGAAAGPGRCRPDPQARGGPEPRRSGRSPFDHGHGRDQPRQGPGDPGLRRGLRAGPLLPRGFPPLRPGPARQDRGRARGQHPRHPGPVADPGSPDRVPGRRERVRDHSGREEARPALRPDRRRPARGLARAPRRQDPPHLARGQRAAARAARVRPFGDHQPVQLRKRLGEILLAQGAISEEQLRAALARQQNRSVPLGRLLVEAGAVDEETVARALARQARLPFVDLAGRRPPERLTGLLDPGVAWEHEVLPVAEKDDVLIVAVADPAKAVILDTLRFLLDREVTLALAAETPLRQALERSYGPPGGGRGRATAAETAPAGDEAPVVRLVHRMFEEAVAARASDIHIEPFADKVRIRYRVDGRLRVADEHPRDLHAPLLSHLKVSAGLDIAEKRKPQDGRIEHEAGGRVLDVRTSTLPTNHGETCVMRLLDREANLLSLEELGMGEQALAWFRRVIERPNGIFLVTGPTGSGKTTTLYAALQTLNRPDRKILTVEDPVEYRLRGINQVQVHPQIGLDFARVLRAFLRQAPNIVLVGEIRDRETAEVAIQASLTGHLVFSTVHTNDAPSAVTRLLDMGVPPFLIATSLQGVLAQRLVRRLCPDCAAEEEATPLERALLGLPAGARLRHPRGCRACQRTGYRGRVGVFEWLEMNEELREQLFAADDPNAFRSRAAACGAWTALAEDVRAKVLAGTTTVQEMLRVTRVEIPTEEEERVPPAAGMEDKA
ncbi:MAG: type II/IV secretion system protein [Planctomycetota bacterium]|nr:MAG: type II/IV secretion system protein [Planctomycetota bacterium]